jgi:hypothetical protein
LTPTPTPPPAPQVAPAPTPPLDANTNGNANANLANNPDIPAIIANNARQNPETAGDVDVTTANNQAPKIAKNADEGQKADWLKVLCDGQEMMEKAIQSILHKQDPARVRDLADVFARTANGAHWPKASADLGIAWPQISGYLAVYPLLRGLWQAAQEMGKAWRDECIENALFARGVEGWEESVFQGGRLVGSVRKFSDRCLELIAKANMPKYAATAAGGDGGTAQVQVVIWGRGSDAPPADTLPPRNQEPPSKVIDVAPQ